MGESINQIERHIAAERDQLGRNLNELEIKARQFVDWRTHYRNNPKVLLGIALGGGLMLGAMAGRGRSSSDRDSPESSPRLPRPQSRLSRQMKDTWLNISDALLGIASAKVLALVSSAVPGFSEQVNRSRTGGASDQRGSAH